MRTARHEVKAISSMALRTLLPELFTLAVSPNEPPVSCESVGGVDAARRVSEGEQVDLAFLDHAALVTLAAGGHVLASSITPVVRSVTAVAMRAGSSQPAIANFRPAFANAAEVRAAVLDANRIGYSTGPSGTALLQKLDVWGLLERMTPRLVQARPGVPVARLLVDGDVDLGFQQLSELVGEPFVRILGVLPADCAIETVFSGAVTTASAQPAAARDVLEFLRSPAALTAKTAHSFRAP